MSDAKQKILLVEDDLGLQKQLKWSLADYELIVAADRDSAIAQLRRHEPPVVLLDLGLPPDADGASEGLEALQQILSLSPVTKVIVVTGNLDRSNAVKAIHLGAYECRETLRALGGNIEVESSPGQGTRFRLTLPLDNNASSGGDAA